jgi:ribosomal-protein-alanine N-acetyltransferase
MSFGRYVRSLDVEGRAGRTLPFAIEVDGHIAGQMHLFGVVRGSLLSGAAGYWVGQSFSGCGVATRALAVLIDHAFGPVGLHRVEVNIRPENEPSLAVVRHLRMREEGSRERFLHIEGAWRDHRSFAITREEADGRPVVERWLGGASGY